MTWDNDFNRVPRIFFLPNFVCTQNVFRPNFFFKSRNLYTKIFQAQKYFDFLTLKKLLSKLILLSQKKISDPISFSVPQKFFSAKNQKLIFTKLFEANNVFVPCNVFGSKLFLGKKYQPKLFAFKCCLNKAKKLI